MNNFLSGLYIVSTPIGNLEDITLRALNVLKNSDKILCEDTRRSIKLLNHYKISNQLVSNHKFNEKKTAYKIVEDIKSGQVVSMISDAGTPTISDPGLVLINECKKICLYSIMVKSILDPKVKGKRYRSGDELVDMLRPNFMGQVGMRIMQRPQGASVFKDEDGNFDKAAMDTCLLYTSPSPRDS